MSGIEKNMRFVLIIIGISVILAVFVIIQTRGGKNLFLSTKPEPTIATKLKICPDAWYKNEQPCVYQNSPDECNNPQREYFVINGQRRELQEFDVEWIKKNCTIKEPVKIY